MAVILLMGFTSYSTIPLESYPDVTVPVIVVTIPLDGISPEDAERLLTKPAEVEIRAVEGVEEITSYSTENISIIVIEFDFDFDPDDAVLNVRAALDKARVMMPPAVGEPEIREIVAAEMPIVTVSLGGRHAPERLVHSLAVDLQRKLEAIPDVLQVTMNGHREEILEAEVSPAQLESLGVSHQELLAAITSNNRLIPAGAINSSKGSFSVKVPGLIETRSDVLGIPIRANSDGVTKLADIVNLKRTFKDATRFTRANGDPVIVLEIAKRSGTNLVEVVEQIRRVVEQERLDYPNVIEVGYLADQAPGTALQVDTLEGNISTALFLVLTVVVAAIGFRSGLLVALGIPFSFLFAFIVISILDFSYNFMVMFGMLLGLGMLIDGAIVVVEHADRRMAEGVTPRDAFVESTQRMFWPVVASTCTTLAAFLPLMLWPGVTGGFMKYLPVTVFAVLAGALAYALIFAPVLGAMYGKSSEQKTNDSAFVTGYIALLKFVVVHPFIVVSVTIFTLSAITLTYLNYGRGLEYFTTVDPEFTGISIHARGNYSAEAIRDIVVDIEQQIIAAGYHKTIYTRTGGANQLGGAEDRVGAIIVEFSDRHSRNATGSEIEDIYRSIIGNVPGVRAEIIKQEPGPPVGKDIQIQIEGENLSELMGKAREIRSYLEDHVDGLIAIDDTTPVPGIEWQITVDRAQAAIFGADVTSVGTAVQLVTNGALIGRYRPDNAEQELEIRLRFPKSHRGIHQLDNLRVKTNAGLVPISSFVERKAKMKVGTIVRINGNRVYFVRANVEPGVIVGDKVEEIENWQQMQSATPGASVTFRGANEEQSESIAFITRSFSFSLFLMGVLLITQFNSFYQASLILSAVIMSTVGVLLGLLILDQTFSAIMTGVGVVALAGIIVNNNIVLIDTFNVLRKQHPGTDIPEIIVMTGAQRLRPVFLTTFTTGFGLLPMAAGVSVDLINAEVEVGGPVATFWVQLASAIVSGLTFATLLTLIVTPAMLSIPHHLGFKQPQRRFTPVSKRLGIISS
jgi:multidrug efflux pump